MCCVAQIVAYRSWTQKVDRLGGDDERLADQLTDALDFTLWKMRGCLRSGWSVLGLHGKGVLPEKNQDALTKIRLLEIFM